MSDPIQPRETEAVDSRQAGEPAAAPLTGADGSHSQGVRTYERPANAGRPRLNPLVFIVLLIILALLSYAAFRLIR